MLRTFRWWQRGDGLIASETHTDRALSVFARSLAVYGHRQPFKSFPVTGTH